MKESPELINPNTTKASLESLRNIISKWYLALRNLALVGLLSVLVYTGIRIIISSTAQDKAKYKERIIDWIVALCLLFFLHYIMLLTITISNSITEMLTPTTGTIPLRNGDKIKANGVGSIKDINSMLSGSGVQIWYKDGDWKNLGMDSFGINKEAGVSNYAVKDEIGDINQVSWTYNNNDYKLNVDLRGFLGWDKSTLKISEFTENGVDKRDMLQSGYNCPNLMSLARLYSDVKDKGERFAFVIVYAILVLYTVMFVFRYMKRLIYLAFLTLMAPLVAFTYPIDKIKDGQAQAFNMWLKEYVFNVIIQPFHLLIYTILVGSAIELAATNLVYAVVAIGFILPAESLLRKFFGFEKASTLSGAGSFAAGAGVASMLNMLKKPPKIPGLDKGGNKDKGGEKAVEDDGKVNFYNDKAGSALDALGGQALGSGNDGQPEDDGDDNNTPLFGQDDNNEQLEDEENERDPVLDQYHSEGYDQNSDGQYFNPWTDEYDENYDPHNDDNYLQQPTEPTEPLDEPEQIPQPQNDNLPQQDLQPDLERQYPQRRTLTAPKGAKGRMRRLAKGLGGMAVNGGKKAFRKRRHRKKNYQRCSKSKCWSNWSRSYGNNRIGSRYCFW